MSEVAIRFEPIVRTSDSLTVAAQISGVAAEPYRLWYRLPGDHEIDELAMAHAFAVSVINQAMALGRDLVVEGPLTRGLISNLDEYQRVWSSWMPRKFRPIAIRARELVADEPYRSERGVILPFSGGLDSAYTALMLKERHSLRALVAIQGLDIALSARDQWNGALSGMSAMARSLGSPLLLAACNWQEVAPRLPGYLGYLVGPIATAILLSRTYGETVIPSYYPYDRLELPIESNPLTDPLLGRPGFPVRHHGAWAHRIDKVAAISCWAEALQHLRPCLTTTAEGSACGRCHKCIRTALLFAALDIPVPAALGGKLPAIADLEGLRMLPIGAIDLRDAVAAARRRGAGDAWIAVAERRIAEFGALPPAADQLEELARRLDYVLGGTNRPAPVRLFRRITRALRGLTGPSGLAPWRGPAAGAASPQPAGARAPLAAFAVSPGGRKIFVDSEDWRGMALIARSGDLDPAAQRAWRYLVASRPWTHIVDVGANYGEMLIDLDIAEGVRVMAVEPNPHVCWHLERSLRAAERPVEVVQKAVSDHDGTVELIIDRTWSGMSGAVAHPLDTAGHRLEPIRVEATTLRHLLAGEMPDEKKHVLVKIDVEGQEVAVLRGLNGAATTFAAFAALVEIRHLPQTDLAAIMQLFSVHLFDPHAGALTPVPDAAPDQLMALLNRGGFHAHDVVLRPRPS
jgi:FkbM family methyltransferase